MRALVFGSLVSVFYCASPGVYGHEGASKHRHAKSHVHGIAEMNLVTDANKLQVDFNIPLADLVGFEHKPQNDQEKKKINQELTNESFRSAVALNETAQCKLMTSHVHSTHTAEQDSQQLKNKPGSQPHDQEKHGEANISLSFVCQQIEKLAALEVKLFEKYPGMSRIKAQYVVKDRQGYQTLSKTANVLNFQ